MMQAKDFCKCLKQHRIDFFTYVPCSILRSVIHNLENDMTINSVAAVREDTAVGLSVGAYLSGKKPVVMMQNSGLGVCLNALTSLVLIYRIPILLVITWRGYQGKDAPEHVIMGKSMLDILNDIGVPYEILEKENIESQITATINRVNSEQKVVALILRKGILL